MSSPPEVSTPPAIFYSVDPNTNPSTWPSLANTTGTVSIWKVDVIFININAASDFRLLRTGTNGHVHEAVNQVTKHVARGLYRIISMNVSEYCCHVVMVTEIPRDELMWKNGFPWDRTTILSLLLFWSRGLNVLTGKAIATSVHCQLVCR